jgi:hypothetical protein
VIGNKKLHGYVPSLESNKFIRKFEKSDQHDQTKGTTQTLTTVMVSQTDNRISISRGELTHIDRVNNRGSEGTGDT